MNTNPEIKQIKLFSVGDYVVSDIFKTFKGFPYVIKVKKVDTEFGVVDFDFKGEQGYIGSETLRMATKFEKFFGPIYDFLLK
jgi:hypothetical protein